MKLRQVGIDPAWFAINGFGDEAATRSALVRLAMERAEKRLGRSLTGGEVLVVGDTPRDVEAAKDNGCLCAVVATGNYSIDVLRMSAADLVVPDLHDLEPLFDLALGPAPAG
jgi:phosphoglycolate phosphatase-like HAD superfamily hydrolase